jgi:hypothetical protein
MERGCLCNSFVMIGAAGAFLELLRRTQPELLVNFESLPAYDAEPVRRLYATLPASNFSEDVLSACPSALTVLRTVGLARSDLGEPQRVLSVFPTAAVPALAAAF